MLGQRFARQTKINKRIKLKTNNVFTQNLVTAQIDGAVTKLRLLLRVY